MRRKPDSAFSNATHHTLAPVGQTASSAHPGAFSGHVAREGLTDDSTDDALAILRLLSAGPIMTALEIGKRLWPEARSAYCVETAALHLLEKLLRAGFIEVGRESGKRWRWWRLTARGRDLARGMSDRKPICWQVHSATGNRFTITDAGLAASIATDPGYAVTSLYAAPLLPPEPEWPVRRAPDFTTMKGLQFYAKDSDGQWHYVNHGNTWRLCPPPFPPALTEPTDAMVEAACVAENGSASWAATAEPIREVVRERARRALAAALRAGRAP